MRTASEMFRPSPGCMWKLSIDHASTIDEEQSVDFCRITSRAHRPHVNEHIQDGESEESREVVGESHIDRVRAEVVKDP